MSSDPAKHEYKTCTVTNAPTKHQLVRINELCARIGEQHDPPATNKEASVLLRKLKKREPISPKQKDYITMLSADIGQEPPDLNITMGAASSLIKSLLSTRDSMFKYGLRTRANPRS